MTYQHLIRVRYAELDLQGVVFNANYLMYCDDTMDTWLRNAIPEGLEQYGLDLMLKKVVLEWYAPARMGDTLTIEARVSRWGNTSFDVRFDTENIFEAVITYVCVQHLTTAPTRFPDDLREKL
jgi:acyl-CoA thioester hydrolase